MALDDREQKILEEIERQFYEEDPKLAESVRTANIASISTKNLKWALLALVAGLGVMLGFFTVSTYVALAGFVVMVLAVVWLLAIIRKRAGMSFSRGIWNRIWQRATRTD